MKCTHLGLILPLVFFKVATVLGPEPCLHPPCTCHGDRLMCSPYHLVGGQWVEMHELPTIIRDLGLPNMHEIDFRYNRIHYVGPSAFQGLYNLNTLWLSHNIISTLSSTAFNNLPYVQVIDLSYNSLQALRAGEFTSTPPLNLLQTIDLSYNRIVVLEQGCFTAIPNLKQLYLHHNPLSFLDQHSFTGLHLLNSLSLALSQPRSAAELMDVLEPLSSLRLLFLEGVVGNCSCDWVDAVEALGARGVDVMDKPQAVARCIDLWRYECDAVVATGNSTLFNIPPRVLPRHNLTLEDLVPPVVRGNNTLLFPDGTVYVMDSMEAKRKLYQYDRTLQEQITRIPDDETRETFKRTLEERMTEFIRAHYVLNNSDPDATQIKVNNHNMSSTFSSKSSPSSTPKKAGDKPRKSRKGMPTGFIWLIVGGLACGLVVLFISAMSTGCRDTSIIVKDVHKDRLREKKKTGFLVKLTEKLSLRKQYMQGTAQRKHAKQKFARNNFVDMHNKAKNKLDEIDEWRISDNHGQLGQTSSSRLVNSVPGGRKSTGGGNRSVLADLRTGPIEECDYVGKFYTESDSDDDSDDVDEETDLFRR